MTTQDWKDLSGWAWTQLGKILGLVAAMATAIIAIQSSVIPEPYNHWVALVAAASGAGAAYILRPFEKRDPETGTYPSAKSLDQ